MKKNYINLQLFAEKIANARAEHAQKSALTSHFKQQGMIEDEVSAALADYKTKKASSTPNTSKLQSQLYEAN